MGYQSDKMLIADLLQEPITCTRNRTSHPSTITLRLIDSDRFIYWRN